MSPSQLNSPREAIIPTSQPENGFIDPVMLVTSEKAVHDLLQQIPVHGGDDNLTEFSESLRTVAKALTRAAEGKASAHAEAVDWKRKYKLERARNLQLEQKEKFSRCHNGDLYRERAESKGNGYAANGKLERCCGKHGICSHEVLSDGQADSPVQNKTMKKASFKLSWCCNGDQSDRHNHDIVSFEKGNIITASRSSKQISLKWESPPQTVLILTKPNSVSVQVLCARMVRWLKEQKNLKIYVEPRVKRELLVESCFFKFVETWKDDHEISNLHLKVDLVVTLGGDGTVLWAASMFKGPVPPIVPFSL
ncbi:hypothetical protein SAY86_003157 [Trapa natans]|uniref:NAD(+) kinase n=1 Tax=Trapa natans TaxID=22666 RepID=A0AAN7R5D7_TRANT|nr:hypothetical protein SAY86_003157 [Trapa natans]